MCIWHGFTRIMEQYPLGMMVAYLVFYGIIALAMLMLTEFSKSIRVFAQKHFIHEKQLKITVNPRYHDILTKYFSYYKGLSHEGKLKFLNRVSEFIKQKHFVGMENLKVTMEMRVLISASAIQLTFGLKKFLLDYFTTIRIYPHYFYSRILKAELKGGASETGVLMISWEDFLLGFKNPHDNLNLGLHEMAHVLKINMVRGIEFDDKFSFYLDEWERIGNSEFSRLRQRDKSLLREYGGMNQHEFFAVCVEHFFESPGEFKEELPDIYNHLCFLLNQDPLNTEENYRLRTDFEQIVNKNRSRVPIPKYIKEHYKYHGWHWAYTVMLAGIFAGIISTIMFYTITMIPVLHILFFAFIGGMLAFIIQYRFLVIKHQVFKPADFALYSVFGVMPLVAGLFLFLNYTVRVSFSEETHLVKSYEHRAGEVIVQLEDNAYDNHTAFRTLRGNEFLFKAEGEKKLKLRFAKGLFGYSIMVGKEIVR